jgi:thiol:disulfide interchange protein
MYFRIGVFILLVSMIGSGCKGGSQKIIQSTEKETTMQIQWVYSLSDGLKLAKEKNKPLMVYFYADWCGWCKKLEMETYRDSEVMKLSSNFVCVKVNTDRNIDESRKYKVSGLPTIVFLKSDGKIIEKVIGYRGSKDFMKIMSEVIKSDKIQ